jgi:hypothetical protein
VEAAGAHGGRRFLAMGTRSKRSLSRPIVEQPTIGCARVAPFCPRLECRAQQMDQTRWPTASARRCRANLWLLPVAGLGMICDFQTLSPFSLGGRDWNGVSRVAPDLTTAWRLGL